MQLKLTNADKDILQNMHLCHSKHVLTVFIMYQSDMRVSKCNILLLVWTKY